VVQPGLDGGAEWGGAAFDPRSGRLYVNANDVPYVLRMLPTPRIRGPGGIGRAAYVMSCAPCHGVDRAGVGLSPPLTGLRSRLGPLEAWRVIRDGRGRMPGSDFMRPAELALLLYYLYFPGDHTARSEAPPADAPPQLGLFPRYIHAGWAKLSDPDGFPGSAPPWGTLTAIDLERGEIDWQVPLGAYPELAAQGLTDTGAENYGGPAITSGGLLFIAATPDARLRAFGLERGRLLWEAELPAAGFATPAIYEAGGRPFVVIAAGGGRLRQPSGSRYVAYSLPP
jgi:quinoprotein glucose dehydrogenase